MRLSDTRHNIAKSEVAHLADFQPEHLYPIWLELNGYPRPVDARLREEYWNTRGHRSAVALDLAIYVWVTPILVSALYSLTTAAAMLVAIPISMVAIQTRLPRIHPYAVAGPVSLYSDCRYNRKLGQNRVSTPAMTEVDLFSLPVMERAASLVAAPTLQGLDEALQSLVTQAVEASRQVSESKELVRGIEYEIRRSDAEWQSILKAKLADALRFHDNASTRLAKIETARNALEGQRQELAEGIERLQNRRKLLDKLAEFESGLRADPGEEEAFESLLCRFIDQVQDAKAKIAEAQQIACAGEQAKQELDSYVRN